MKFYINQYATLPILAVTPVYNNAYVEASDINNMLENAAITFTMTNSKGKLVVPHKSANLLSKDDCDEKKDVYLIYYKFTEEETSVPGIYKGQFKIDFFNEEGSTPNTRGGLILPLKEDLEIIINPSSIRTTII